MPRPMTYPRLLRAKVTDETYAAVLAYAASRGVPVAEVVREAVERMVGNGDED